ncbi:MAG: efflux transporter outer membrane subunit [Sphingomonas sp.]
MITSYRRTLFAILALSLVGGCAAGPDFKTPAAPEAPSYTHHALTTTSATPGIAGGEAQRFSTGDIPADWWTLFHSKPLNALIEQALAHNPDLKAAQAALTVARENTLAQHGASVPHLSAGIAVSREQDPPGSLAPVPSTNAFLYNLFTPQLSISYAPDIFGLNRRTTESAAAQEQAVRYQMIAAHITLSSNVAVAAIQDAALEAQVDATRQLVDINKKMLGILQYQLGKGYASGVDLAAQQAQFASTEASLPPLLKQLSQQRNLLSVLSGRLPNQASPEIFELSSLTLPQDLPVSLPSVLVRQRPDVLQAEANMRSANAQVGVATANRLPNITLTANAGSTALEIGQIFGPGTGFWNIGAGLLAPIFDGGTLLHQQRGARAAYLQTAEQYRSTVLTAFQNVADTLVALEQDADGLKASAAAADAAKTSLDLSQLQYKDGYVGYLNVLSAEQAYQQARIALVQAQASRFSDTAALFQALGGGWWHRADLTSGDHAQ